MSLLFRYLLRALMIKPYLVLFVLMLSIFSANSQEVIKVQSCNDQLITRQVDSLKKLYSDDGYVLMKEASITMESEYEMPVIVPLTEGSWYYFVFIGDPTSRLYELRMFDFNEKQIIYKKQYGEGLESNIISYSYIPKFSEYHIIKPVQVNKSKKKNICGYIIMFKKAK